MDVGSVSARDWLDVLADPASSLDFPVFFSGTVSREWSFTERRLDDHLIYLITNGSCVGTIDREPITLAPGSFLWMQPRTRHTLALAKPRQPITLHSARFRLSRDGTEPRTNHGGHWQRDNAWDVLELMDQLLDELGAQLPHRRARLRGLMLAICAHELRPAVETRTRTLSRHQRRAAETYATEHVADWPTPRDLADQLHLSHDYFSRLFTHTYGMPPRAWLVRERVRHGARLLTETPHTVGQVAKSLGYDDVSAFSHQFKQAYGLSPRHFRDARR